MKTPLSLLFICFWSSLFAQPLWNLETCILYAKEHNVQIKLQEINYLYNKNTLSQSRANVLPSVNGSANQNLNYGRQVDPYTNEFIESNVKTNNFALNAQWTLFNGLQNYHTIEQNKLTLYSSLMDLEKMKNDISLQVATFYLQILYSDENLESAIRQKQTTDLQLERIKKQVEAGKLAKGDLYQIEAQLANDELQIINAKNNLQLAYLNLSQLLEISSPDSIRVQKPNLTIQDNEILIANMHEIYQTALQLPQIKSASAKVQSSQQQLSVAKGRRSPQLTLAASYGTGYSDARQRYDIQMGDPHVIGQVGSDPNMLVYAPTINYLGSNYPFFDQLKDNASTYFSIRLSVPIFNNRQIQTSVNNAKLNIKNNEYQLELAEKGLYKEIQQAYNDASSSLARYQGTQKSLLAQQESFKYVEQRYNNGMLTNTEYFVSKNQLSLTESQLIQAKYEYVFKKNILNFYAGKPFDIQ